MSFCVTGSHAVRERAAILSRRRDVCVGVSGWRCELNCRLSQRASYIAIGAT